MVDFCPVELEFRDSSSLYEYGASELVKYIHSWPRFGISKDFPASLFIQNEDNDVNESLSLSYLTGVFMWSFVFSSLLIIYILILSAYNLYISASNGEETAEKSRDEEVEITHVAEASSRQTRGKQYSKFPLPLEQQQQPHTGNARRNESKQGQISSHSRQLDSASEATNARTAPQHSINSIQEFHGTWEDEKAQVYNQLGSDHILRHLQTSDSSATLPQSQFVSPTVSRKRLLEAYFDSIMNTSTMLKLGLIDGTNCEEEVRQQPNERNMRVMTSQPSDIQRDQPRRRWTFSEVFASPRQEDDDGSTFQPPRKAKTFDEDDSTLASGSNKTSRDHEAHFLENREIEIKKSVDDGDISPRTATSGSSDSAFDDQHLSRSSAHLASRTRQQSSALKQGSLRSAQKRDEPDSCFQMLTLLAGFLLLLFASLLCSDGLLPLGKQSNLMDEEWQKVLYSALETEQIVNEVQDLQSSLYEASAFLIQSLNTSCPAVQPSLCTEVGVGHTCDVMGIPLNEDWEILLDIGIQPSNITEWSQERHNWTLANQDLEYLTEIPFESTLKSWRWMLRAAGICNVTLFFLVLLILWSIVIPKRQHRIQDSFVRKSRSFLWLFWISTLLIWGFAIVSLAGTFVLSDFCVNAPSENTIEVMLGNETSASHSFLSREFWNYHINGCPLEQYPDSLQEEIEEWSGLLGPTTDLHASLQSLPTTQFELICGAGSGQSNSDLKQATSDLQSKMCSLVQSLASLRGVLECKKWSPQFESIVYRAVCEDGANEVCWSAMAQWIIVVMSLTIWTFQESFRSATKTKPNRPSCNRKQVQRLEHDRLGKFPILPTGSTDKPLAGHHENSSTQDAPRNLGSHQMNLSEATTSHLTVECMREKKRAPLDPPEFDSTAVQPQEIMTVEAEGSQLQTGYPFTQNRGVESITDQITTRGLDLHDTKEIGYYAPKGESGIPSRDSTESLPVPRPTAGNRSAEVAEAFLLRAADNASEDDLESL